MKPRILVLPFVLAVGFLSGRVPLSAQQPQQGAPPAGLTEWRPSTSRVVPGSAAMLLLGDPSKHELFAARFRYPNGSRLAPHWHTASVHVTVLEGTLMVGMGDVVDTTRAQAYGPGSFVVFEGGMHHYEWFRGDVVVHVEGVGPFRTVFVNPADDPRSKP